MDQQPCTLYQEGGGGGGGGGGEAWLLAPNVPHMPSNCNILKAILGRHNWVGFLGSRDESEQVLLLDLIKSHSL